MRALGVQVQFYSTNIKLSFCAQLNFAFGRLGVSLAQPFQAGKDMPFFRLTLYLNKIASVHP